MRMGVIKYWKQGGSFGFIVPDDGKTSDVFCHYSCIDGEGYREFAIGDRVEFTSEDTNKGPQATLARKLEE